jgi:hypothetical protein
MLNESGITFIIELGISQERKAPGRIVAVRIALLNFAFRARA